MTEIVGRLGDQTIYRTAVDEVARFNSALQEGSRLAREDGRMEGRPKTPGEAVAWWERWMDEYVKWEVQAHTCGLKHYGVWHPERGWTVNNVGEVIAMTNKALAMAQRDRECRYYNDDDKFEIRCIEEWADERR